MKTHPFQLRPNQEYIELHKLLKFMGVAESGAEAKALVAAGQVNVDGAREERKACKIRAGQVVETGEARITVAAAAEAGQ
jgi:ribosome-associated protein